MAIYSLIGNASSPFHAEPAHDVIRNGYAQREIPDELFGSVKFSPRFTSAGRTGQGHPYADFLLGIPTESSRAFPPVLIEMGRWQYGFYLQDEFKLSPKLTLGFGLRYQLQQPWSDLRGRLAIFDIAQRAIVVPENAASQVSPLFPTGYVPVIGSSKAGLPDTLREPTRTIGRRAPASHGFRSEIQIPCSGRATECSTTPCAMT